MFEITEEEAKQCAVITNLEGGNTIRIIPQKLIDRFNRYLVKQQLDLLKAQCSKQ